MLQHWLKCVHLQQKPLLCLFGWLALSELRLALFSFLEWVTSLRSKALVGVESGICQEKLKPSGSSNAAL